MKNRDGVRQLGKGLYEVNFRPSSAGADRVFRRVNVQSLQEARTKRAELIAEENKKNNAPIIHKDRQNSSYEELKIAIERSLLADNKNRKTINRFMSCWRAFKQFLIERHPDITSINDLKEAHFEDYKNYIVVDKKREKGWRAELTIIKAIFKRLKRKGYCNKDVLEELKELKRPARIKKAYEHIPNSEIKKILSYIKDDRPHYYGLTATLYKCGWRIEETTLLRKADIKWNGLNPLELLIRAESTKTKKERIFDMFDDELRVVFRQYAFNNKKTVWLFPNKNNRKIHSGHYREYLKEVSRNIIGKAITPHYFRHRLCTVAAANNVPVNDIKAITGIQDLKVLLTYYQHTTVEGKAKVLALSSLK